MRWLSMSFRVRAFFLHLSASALLALISLVVVFYLWYPAPLYSLLGVVSIFAILLLVDVIVGPLLTLFAAKEHKKSLKFDLSVIISLQLLAFGYGMYVVAEGRPVWLVYTGDRFEVVQAYELEPQYSAIAAKQFSSQSWFGPAIVGAKIPEDPDKKSDLMFLSLAGGSDLAQRPDLYVPYEDVTDRVGKRAYPVSRLAAFNAESDVRNILGKWSEADAYLPLYNRNRGAITVLLKRDTAEIVAIVELIPW